MSDLILKLLAEKFEREFASSEDTETCSEMLERVLREVGLENLLKIGDECAEQADYALFQAWDAAKAKLEAAVK